MMLDLRRARQTFAEDPLSSGATDEAMLASAKPEIERRLLSRLAAGSRW
jgi:hypothetical protein